MFRKPKAIPSRQVILEEEWEWVRSLLPRTADVNAGHPRMASPGRSGLGQ